MKNWDGGEEEMEGDTEGEKKGRRFRDLVRIWANTRKKVHKMRHKVSDLRQNRDFRRNLGVVSTFKSQLHNKP